MTQSLVKQKYLIKIVSFLTQFDLTGGKSYMDIHSFIGIFKKVKSAFQKIYTFIQQKLPVQELFRKN